MRRVIRMIGAASALALAAPSPAWAKDDSALDSLARSVSQTESVRAVKTLQRSYAQYAQFGLWEQIGALFAADGSFVFDGQITPAQTARGPHAIAAFLRSRYGGGREGADAAGLSTMAIENPVVNLSADGTSAKARWDVLVFHGHDGQARIEGGVFENEYVLDGGVWKIEVAHYYPQYDGAYETGWTNWGGGALPIVPFHFDVDGAGTPIPAATGSAPATGASLASLQARIDELTDEDRIRSLQSAYGFYQDRKMWDDVVDLFPEGGVVEIGGQGVWKGKAGVRRWLETMGGPGLSHGQLNDQVQLDTTVTVAPGGSEAWARGIELGMLGDADREKGWWQVTAFANRYVKEHGVWKLRELRRFPVMKTDIFQGWGKSRIVDPVPVGGSAPDVPAPAAGGTLMPAFIAPNPVTGARIAPEGDARLAAATALTGPIAAVAPRPAAIGEAKRRLARAAAWDGIENVSAAYGYFLDDSMPRGFGGVIATKGFKMSPFSGFYITRDRVLSARVSGEVPATRPGISYHWLVQPVVQISDDGRSAKGRFRLFQPRTGKDVGKAGAFYGASFWGGMYHDRYVLEDGVWRIWELTLDEPYITPVAWGDGLWAKARDPDPSLPRRSFTGGNFPPDVPLTALGKREEGFAGGTGTPLQWPSIMPMWFGYTNPVSGRVPTLYQPGCVPCAVRPELDLEANGYQEPPDAPAANTAP
ncbi:MAG: nuclear transport factor 2 family protein [Novosphingobium sp.]|nr:nuclear transport factor 2 family protein [Novosphingobium sp.]